MCAGFFFLFVYIYIVVGDPNIKNGRIEIPLTGLTPSYFFVCVCAHPRVGISTSYVVVVLFV
jgi:hypothetical protein